ncbi:hypothetical protein IV203_004476 [Nitzschia inconspicua]|uniref:Uncharacterized protein n=1 Tax=Nitzschia inconspicua TaxID=303405 RepID=A0A9K3PPA4_9STRA|nr:hypothetical protein IV203_004476 [Nitzschia inconspicua]
MSSGKNSPVSASRCMPPTRKKKSSTTILGRLRILKVSPSKERQQEYVSSGVTLPNEVVVVDSLLSPSSFTVHEEIEESLETMKKVLRKPCRFTFDVVPSLSESFGDQHPTEEDEIASDVVRTSVSGLSILEDNHENSSTTCAKINSKMANVGNIGPTKLDHRSRTNSTSATSALSSSDIFCGSTGHKVVKNSASDTSFLDPQQNQPSPNTILKRSNGKEASWTSIFSFVLGSSSVGCVV